MGGMDFATPEKASHGVEGDGSEHIFFAQIFQNFQMQRTMMPGVAFGEIDGDLNGHNLKRHHSAWLPFYSPRASAAPARTAARQSALLATMLMLVRSHCPCS